jgi:tetratricopeptide (TPR) repeat protein
LARSRSSPKGFTINSKWRARAVLLVIALAAYVNSFGLGLAQDSTVLVKDTRLELTGDNLRLILERNYWWPAAGDGLYRPVTTLSFVFNYWFLGNGRNPAAYHLTNFVLHAVNVWLVYELALLLFGRAGPAFFAAALWAVHPICTESVTSIAGRADLLAALAILGGLLLYLRAPGKGGPLALFTIATAGVFAKENAAVLIGLMLLWDLSFRSVKSALARNWQYYAAAAASLLVLVAVRYVVFSQLAPVQPPYVDNPLLGADFWTAHWTAIRVLGLDLWLLAFPLTLSSDHPQRPLATLSDPRAWLALAVVAAILALVAMRRRKDPLLFWAAGFLGITLLPTSNLLVIIGAAMGERFLYLPAMAFVVAITALLYRLKTERYARAALIALMVLYMVRTVSRNPDWNDNASLSSADVPHTPNSFRLRDMMAQTLFAQDALGNIDRAIAEQEASWHLIAAFPPARSSTIPPTLLGQYYADKAELVPPAEQRGWYEKSLAMLLQAREISQAIEKMYDVLQRAHGAPMIRASNPQLYLSLGNTYMHLGDYPRAIEAMRFGQGINPRTLEVYDGLNVAYTATGNFQSAVVNTEEKALVDNFQPATMSALRELYLNLPDGQCAFVQHGAGWEFNMAGCPRVKGDVCAAFAALTEAYRESRSPDSAQQLQLAAVQQYGCPSQ